MPSEHFSKTVRGPICSPRCCWVLTAPGFPPVPVQLVRGLQPFSLTLQRARGLLSALGESSSPIPDEAPLWGRHSPGEGNATTPPSNPRISGIGESSIILIRGKNWLFKNISFQQKLAFLVYVYVWSHAPEMINGINLEVYSKLMKHR